MILSFILIPQFSSQGAAIAYFVTNILVYVLLLLEVDRTIKIYFSKRSLAIIFPVIAMLIILYSTQFFENPLIINSLTALSLVFYALLLLVFKVVNREDLIILDYVPDKFGLKELKKIIIKTIELFE